MNNLKISTRLALMLGLLVAIMLAISGLAALQMRTMNTASHLVTDKSLPSTRMLGLLNAWAIQVRLLETDHVFEVEKADWPRTEKRYEEAKAGVFKTRDEFESLITSARERELYANFIKLNDESWILSSKILDVSRSGDQEKAIELLWGRSEDIYQESVVLLQQMIALNQEEANQTADYINHSYQRSLITIGLGSALAAALALGAGLWITRSIQRPLQRALNVAERVAGGDLTSRIEVEHQDELGVLLAALQRMQNSLADAVRSVRSGADGVATASSQIAMGNADLSGRTAQTGSSLQETAAAMEELSATVRQNADNAQQANQLARHASKVATEGGDVVNSVVETMKDINTSSRKIGDIISVIDGIAFQTNILALNAAVEAARAGEQGRGFAVVAGEVRSLAGRSAEAAKEIKTLIADSVQRVDHGSHLVDQAGNTMNEMVTAIRRVTDIVGEISAASTEQSQGVAQVGHAITQMDQSTQQNAALVEESAAAADNLQRQAQELVHAVAVFRLESNPPNHSSVSTAIPKVSTAPMSRSPSAPMAAPPMSKTVPKLAAPKSAISKKSASTASSSTAVANRSKNSSDDEWESF